MYMMYMMYMMYNMNMMYMIHMMCMMYRMYMMCKMYIMYMMYMFLETKAKIKNFGVAWFKKEKKNKSRVIVCERAQWKNGVLGCVKEKSPNVER